MVDGDVIVRQVSEGKVMFDFRYNAKQRVVRHGVYFKVILGLTHQGFLYFSSKNGT